MFRKLCLFLALFVAYDASGAVILFDRTQQAEQTPFDNASNTFTATDVQAAIEEARDTARGQASRYAVIFGLQGNKSNAWLNVFASIGSDSSPYVAAEPGEIKAMSVANKNSSGTTIYTLYKNGVAVDTLTRSGTQTAFEAGLTIPIVAGDELSAKITTGSSNDTVFAVTIKVD